MRRAMWLLCLVPAVLWGQSDISGDWVATCDMYGSQLHERLTLKVDAGKLSGDVDGDSLDGTVAGDRVHFVSKDKEGNSDELTGTIQGGKITGEVVSLHADSGERETLPCTAERMPQPHAGGPQRHVFIPTKFERQFSAFTKPVLTISPGDTVHTTTVDAGGSDEKGTRRVLGGNPETGPFYVAGAMPGDALAVHFTRIRLNRDYAISDDDIVSRATGSQLAIKMKDAGKTVRWHLDRDRGVASLEKPGDNLKNYSVPIRPMLGCVATAPGFGQPGFGTGDSGRWGGNMDFNQIVEGATVYLPVNQPGALLYVGDGHALQGDGELNGNALETSMDVEFTVDLIHKKQMMGPRVEDANYIMAMGLAGSLDDALKIATGSMAQWLEQDYHLTPPEIAEVMGTSSEFVISEVADRNAGIVAKIRKDRLAGLKR